MCDSRELVSRLMGRAVFEALLIRLPDAFYSLLPEAKDWIWDELLGFVNQGIEDPEELANAASKLMKGELVDASVDEYSKDFAEKLKKEHGDEPVFEVGL
jgi:hypothetical protein